MRRHRVSLPLWCVAILLLSVPPSWGQQELRSGKKGATDPAPITSTSIDANHQALDVNVAGGSLGNVTIENTDGAITDGANNTIKATVKDYTNSNPLAVELVDTNGDPASIGGGTEYAQGTANTSTDVLKMMGCVRVDTPAVASGVIDGDRARCIVDSTGRLWVHVGVIDGTVAATQSGTWNIGTLTSITNPVAVTGTFWQATQPVSGTVTVTDGAGALNVIVDSGTTAATQSGTWTVQPGNTANTTPWLATIAQGGNSATVNGSGQLAVNCANCSGSGVSQQDNTGFTPGTTNFVPMGGEVDDTGTTAVTENNAGVARITAQRAVHMNLRNNSGTEIGTSGNPVRTDPTGSTTQPVSGTVTANAGTGTFFDGIIKDGTGDTTQANVSNGRLQVENYNANLAADNSTNSTSKVPVLAGTANASAPSWTEGRQVPLSTDLSGALRVTGAAGTTQYNQGTAGTATDSLAMSGAVRKDTAAVDAGVADGDRVVLSTDSVGRLRTTSADTTQPVSGTVSITANSSVNVAQVNGSTTQVASNSLNTTGSGLLASAMVGQCDDTSPTSLTENQFGHARINCTTHQQLMEVGTALPTGTNSIGQVTANAGTNLNTSALLTTAAHDAAFGTAGSADTQVRTVQGIASMTPLQVQSNTANLATEASVDGLEGGLGAAADAAATAGSTGSVTAKLRLMTSQLDTISTAIAAIQTATQLIDDDQTGASVHYRTSAGSTEDEHEVKGSAGRLFSITATNTNAAARYLRCANQVIGSTTPGTTTVFLGLAIPGATTGAGFTTNFGPTGIAFSTGLTCWLVTGAADSDVAEVAANEIKVIYTYK